MSRHLSVHSAPVPGRNGSRDSGRPHDRSTDRSSDRRPSRPQRSYGDSERGSFNRPSWAESDDGGRFSSSSSSDRRSSGSGFRSRSPPSQRDGRSSAYDRREGYGNGRDGNKNTADRRRSSDPDTPSRPLRIDYDSRQDRHPRLVKKARLASESSVNQELAPSTSGEQMPKWMAKVAKKRSRLSPLFRKSTDPRSLPPEMRHKRPPSTPQTAETKPVKVPKIQMPPILYEDDQILIISKLPGVAVQAQPGLTVHEDWNAMMKLLTDRPESPVLKPVHRLDKQTTGCFVFAKTAEKAANLAQQFAKRQVHKTYLAVLWAHDLPRMANKSLRMPKGFTSMLECQLSHDPDRMRIYAPERPEHAGATPIESKTFFECISRSKKFALARMTPITGRKHQLRVHCGRLLKTPIIGDFKYGYYKPPHEKGMPPIPANVMLLHAHTLSFDTWEKSGKLKRIEVCAKPPSVFVNYARANGLALPTSDVFYDLGPSKEAFESRFVQKTSSEGADVEGGAEVAVVDEEQDHVEEEQGEGAALPDELEREAQAAA